MTFRSDFFSLQRLLPLSALAVLSVVFYLNGWVSEDAYINFRVVEQLYGGYGLVWNPGERVQVFTSPLWLILLTAGRIFSSQLFLIAVVISYVLFIAAILVLWKMIRNPLAWLFCCSLFLVSSAFFDYTSSGLEYPLIYLLLALFLLFYLRGIDSPGDRSNLNAVALIFSLLLLTRHDLLLLCLPPFVFYLWQASKAIGPTAAIKSWAIYTAPFWLWTAFSLIYYGFPFPNTAYAKLGTGLDTWVKVREGLRYVVDLGRGDSLSVLVIIVAVLSCLIVKERRYMAIALGIVLSVLYVVSVGGDYMRGRFLSPATAVSIAVLSLLIAPWINRKAVLGAWIGGWILYVTFYYHTPIASNFDHTTYTWQEWAEDWIASNTAIVDARQMHSSISTLRGYLERAPDELFPGGPYPVDALAANETGESVVVYGAIGMFGYLISPATTVVDDMAISDPLLARLPASKPWRVSHYPRTLPEGYLESLSSRENRIVDASLNEYYDRLSILVGSESLFSLERFTSILHMNLGSYDYLLEDYVRRHPGIYGEQPEMMYVR